jgi:hypothetical protein
VVNGLTVEVIQEDIITIGNYVVPIKNYQNTWIDVSVTIQLKKTAILQMDPLYSFWVIVVSRSLSLNREELVKNVENHTRIVKIIYVIGVV